MNPRVARLLTSCETCGGCGEVIDQETGERAPCPMCNLTRRLKNVDDRMRRLEAQVEELPQRH